MVELTEEVIDVMKKIKDSIKESSFKITKFEVMETYENKEMITMDIRRREDEKISNNKEI